MHYSSGDSTAVPLHRLFGELTLINFIEQYLNRLPFSTAGVASPLRHWGTWEAMLPVLTAPGADIMVVRANEQLTDSASLDSTHIQRLSQDGFTVLAKHVERHHTEIAQLAAQFGIAFRGVVDAHVYITPPGQFGFSWHYDAEDVFILQLSGEKEYQLRKNTVNPWPLLETLPHDMQYERELMPLMRVSLAAGDMLYIPGGYWHRAATHESSETAFSLAIGVLPRTAMDVFDLLRPRLLKSMLWRQRLPVLPDDSTENVEAAYGELLKTLSADLVKVLESADFRRTAAGLEAPIRSTESVGHPH